MYVLKEECCDKCSCKFHNLDSMHIYNGGLVCTDCLKAFEALDNMIQGKITWIEHLRYCISQDYKERV